MTKNIILQFTFILLFLASCKPSSTNKPTLEDYKVGEQWTWKWESATNGKVRGKGEDIRKVVNYKGSLGLWNGSDTLNMADILNKKQSDTPYRSWPLKVGKKWKYESKWTNESGDKGITSQDAEVISFEEIKLPAGKFMAYKIKYVGYVQNYQAGGKGKVTDTFWYAPKLRQNIKHVQEGGGGFRYTSELIGYKEAK